MTTTHEYDAYCDAVTIDDRYHEELPLMEQQIQDEREMKEAYDAALLRRGAKEALEDLKEKIQDHRDFGYKNNFNSTLGLTTALTLLDNCLKDIETPVEVGGIPDSYFADLKGGAA